MKLYKALLLGFAVWVCFVRCAEDEVVGDDDDDDEDEKLDPLEEAKKNLKPGEQVISYKQPQLSEEEQRSHHFPKGYLCEACQIVVHNMGTAFGAAEKKISKKSKKNKLGDVDVMEVVENVCDKSGFDKYAIQQYEGRVTFKGPAFPERDQPGMSMGGGLWPSRYVNYCGNLLEDFEEDEIYENYRSGNLFSHLCLKKDCKGIVTETPVNVDFKLSKQQPKTEL